MKQFAGMLCAALAMVLTSGPALAQQDFAGSYVVDAAASDDINAAIDAATARMNFIKKPIARKRLREANPPTSTVVIRLVADSIDLVADSTALRARPNTAPFRWSGFRSEALTVTTTLQDGVLEYIFDAGDGRRVNRYRLREDGALVLQVTLTSPRLPSPLRYIRTFRRTDP